jgi:predicted O-linked N-acetylglucosamine transferase (SPINDLY family)
LDDAAAETIIRADVIDVLVDLSGHTAHGRLSLFARRPAPVQAAWLGYVSTTGLPAMDYLITDAETAPPGSERLFTETLLRSPCGRFCYAPPDEAPAVVTPPSLAGKPFVFGSFNDTLKITPRVVRLWAEVVKAAPEARLMLKWRSLDDEGVRNRLTAQFLHAGVDPARLDLRGHSPHPEMLAQYADMDVALDPLSFSGGMTTCEALWMGVPVVTFPEQKPASRQSLSFLTQLGLTELVAASETDYIALASGLARDPERLAGLRRSLRRRMLASPVCQAPAFTAAQEILIRRMWRDWCERSEVG